MVFCKSREDAYKLAVMTASTDFNSDSLSGDMNQECRDQIMMNLRNAPYKLTVFCSNLAARGLDIPSIDHVLILDLESDDFTHRYGRTGRLKAGTVHCFIHEQYDNRVFASLIDVSFKWFYIHTIPFIF